MPQISCILDQYMYLILHEQVPRLTLVDPRWRMMALLEDVYNLTEERFSGGDQNQEHIPQHSLVV